MRLVVEEDHRRGRSPGLEPGGKAPAQPRGEVLDHRERIGRGPGRAGGRALAAARADHRVDHHAVARGQDRSRGAEVQAARAAGLLVARMGAKVGGEVDVLRLVERADHLAGLGHRPRHRRRIARIGAEVARPGLVKERGGPGEVEHEVAARDRPVPRRTEVEARARGRGGGGIGVDGHFEGAEMACPARHAALKHGPCRLARRRHVRAGQEEHGQVEKPRQRPRRLDHRLVAAQEQRDAPALERHCLELRGLDLGHREKCRHLRRGARAVLGPPRRLADVGEAERAGEAFLLGHFGEERRLLRAGDRDLGELPERGPEMVKLRPAKLGRGLARGAERLGGEGHRAFAGADQAGVAGLWHGASVVPPARLSAAGCTPVRAR
jgi:hypothetical protein